MFVSPLSSAAEMEAPRKGRSDVEFIGIYTGTTADLTPEMQFAGPPSSRPSMGPISDKQSTTNCFATTSNFYGSRKENTSRYQPIDVSADYLLCPLMDFGGLLTPKEANAEHIVSTYWQRCCVIEGKLLEPDSCPLFRPIPACGGSTVFENCVVSVTGLDHPLREQIKEFVVNFGGIFKATMYDNSMCNEFLNPHVYIGIDSEKAKMAVKWPIKVLDPACLLESIVNDTHILEAAYPFVPNSLTKTDGPARSSSSLELSVQVVDECAGRESDIRDSLPMAPRGPARRCSSPTRVIATQKFAAESTMPLAKEATKQYTNEAAMELKEFGLPVFAVDLSAEPSPMPDFAEDGGALADVELDMEERQVLALVEHGPIPGVKVHAGGRPPRVAGRCAKCEKEKKVSMRFGLDFCKPCGDMTNSTRGSEKSDATAPPNSPSDCYTGTDTLSASHSPALHFPDASHRRAVPNGHSTPLRNSYVHLPKIDESAICASSTNRDRHEHHDVSFDLSSAIDEAANKIREEIRPEYYHVF
ncbi:unnamed protein product, partial [Mesorhabditis spiculigera]